MDYVCVKRYKGNAIGGAVNIPRGTKLGTVDDFLALGDTTICTPTSQVAYDYFARDDDERGLERGDLIAKIQRKLAKKDDNHQKRWDKLWADKDANKLRRPEHQDFWCWGFQFYNAEISELEHIWQLIKDI